MDLCIIAPSQKGKGHACAFPAGWVLAWLATSSKGRVGVQRTSHTVVEQTQNTFSSIDPPSVMLPFEVTRHTVRQIFEIAVAST